MGERDAVMSLDRGTKLGPYEILAPIGAGGMGEVYKARDTRLDRIVAIKVSNEQFTERFQHEAHAVAALNHPHICTLYDIGQQDGVDFLVMEYLEGQTLQARLSRGPLAAVDVLRYAIEIAEALALAHRHGISHRDLKPGNIMLTKGGAKLLDFGLAKLRECQVPPAGAAAALPTMVPTVTKDLTAKGTILGTFQYMAPEQLEGKPADSRSDIWAFGAVLYEMATGRKAFSGSSQASVIAAILTAQPQPISEQVSGLPALDHVVQKCLAKDAEERWQSAADVKSLLEWIAPGQTAALPGSQAGGTGRRGRRAWMTATGVLLAGGLGLLYFRRMPEPAPIVRFTIEPPAKNTLREQGGLTPSPEFPVVSPDGQQIAFVATGLDGMSQIWVRPVAAPAPQLLPGTVGAVLPFWSPDSRQIGFFAGGKLKRIERASGISQVLADAERPLGGAWSRNRIILFAVFGSGLRVVAASGGDSRQITTVDPASLRTQHLLPHFLPDGNHFLYLATSPGDHAIYAGSLDSKESRRLSPAVASTAYAQVPGGAGYLLFVRNGALLAQRFDATRLTTLSQPFQLTGQVMANPDAMPLVSASDNGVLAYCTGGALGQMAWFDRTGRRLNNLGEPGTYTNPAISPDGKKVAVNQGQGKREIWVYDLTRETALRLTFDPADESNPAWSPDGSRIAFSSNRRGHRDVYVKNANGVGEEELVFESAQDKSVEDWGRDGRFLLIYTLERRGDEWLLPAPGTAGERKLTPLLNSQFIENGGQLSPDGQYVLYASDESGRMEVYVQALPPAKGKWPISTGGGVSPRWAPNGKEIFYLASRAWRWRSPKR
jgi:Tol biopolymer transport system component/tRNA A-37 threonylcarbamoyl transferase component Bud32